jgi:O-methyltransferase involved in polyketide biosynthesis
MCSVFCRGLSGNWTGELVAAGFDPAAPTAWLAEGLMLYLTAGEAQQRLLTAVSGLSTPGSRPRLRARRHRPLRAAGPGA